MKKYLVLVIISLFTLSCFNEKKKEKEKEERVVSETLFTSMESDATGIDFINSVENLKDFNIFTYRNFYNGGGVGIGDINNDGLADVYLTANMNENKLYLNKGNFEFEDISEASGAAGARSWSTGVSMIDINGDGLLDIYVSNAGNAEGDDQKNELFINNGDLTFTEKAKEYNLDDNGFTTHAAFFDYDLDGDLDAYILNNSFIPVSSLGFENKRDIRSEDWNVPDVLKGGGDKLMRNDNGVFTDVSEEAGIYGSLIGFGLGVTVGDVNEDLLPDIYVSNDFYERDYLYINQGDGTFKEQVKDYMQHLSLSSMGADMADINNDGLPEIFVTDMLPEDDQRFKETGDYERYNLYKLKRDRDFYHQYMQNTLQLNNGDGTFSEIAYYAGVGKTDWSWGALMFDMDNDGFKDIFVSNGIYHDLTNNDFMDFFASEIIQKMTLSGKKEEVENIINKMPSTPIPNYAFKNTGGLKFDDQAKDWGIGEPGFSNGAAYGDLDNDGDLDLIINNFNMPLSVYRNNSEKYNQNFIRISVEGKGKNTKAVGSIIEIYIDDQTLRQEVIPTRGFQSSVDYTMSIGLGERDEIDSLRVIFPDRTSDLLLDVPINQLLVLKQEEVDSEVYNPKKKEKGNWLEEINTNFQVHKEDAHLDFDYEGLIPKMQSREGPAVAVGDIDNDGNEDVFIGGAHNQPGRIYLQKQPGQLSMMQIEIDEEFEDTDAAFVDVNSNGFLDLVVVSGGNFQNARNGVRVYINDGKANFGPYQVIAFSQTNVSSIAAFDFDDDGDMDLLMGGYTYPGEYGTSAPSKLLENDGKGNFKDVTNALAPALKEAGMVTAISWADINGDAQQDMVLVGEWMSPMILVNQNGKFTPQSGSLDSFSGLYNTVLAEDIDGDGHTDLVLGNRGTNASFNASQDKPAKMYLADFDLNGTLEQIFTQSIDGRDIPLHTKREITGQITSLRKQNMKFKEYAEKSIDDLLDKEILEQAEVKEITSFESIIAYNDGKGNFEVVPLPARAQFSCICSIAAVDINNDDVLDLILAGNNYGLKPQYARLDASYGNVLLSSYSGYQAQSSFDKEFVIKGEVKALKWLKDRTGQRYLIAGITDAEPKLFKYNEALQ